MGVDTTQETVGTRSHMYAPSPQGTLQSNARRISRMSWDCPEAGCKGTTSHLLQPSPGPWSHSQEDPLVACSQGLPTRYFYFY